MGTASGWVKLRDGNEILQRHIAQIIDTLDGTDPGRPITIKNSGGNVTLLSTSDSGVNVSPNGVLGASNYFIYPRMCVFWNDVAANVPPNFLVLAAAKDRFPWAANVDGDVGTVGGANDHVHTGPSHTHTISTTHTHTSASHSHDLSAHTHTSASHSHDLSAHTHGTNIAHDHANATTANDAAGFSTSVQEGVSGSFKTVSAHTHNHDFDTTALGATTATSGGPSTNSTSSDTPGPTGGPSINSTSSDTPGPTGGTAGGPTDASGTGNTGSSSQQPPVKYWRGYLIERQ